MAGIKKAVVIGGGIAGAVVALALQKAGIASTVHEAYPTTADGVGGALTVAPNGLQALHTIGVDNLVRAIGQPITHMVIADDSGRQLCAFPGLPGLPPSLVMRRADLNRVLYQHLKACGILVEYGKRLSGVAETPDAIVARFTDGSIASADLLIGADGIHSTVRKLIDPRAPDPQYTGLLGFGGCAALASDLQARPGAMHFVYGKRAFLGHWTEPDGRSMWFGGLPHTEPLTMAQARVVPAAEWLRVLCEAYADDVPGRDLLLHTSPQELIVAGAGELLPSVPHWHRGRMVLVGDAAHAPSSSSGQGASLSIESAIQLARCLRDVPDLATAFATYEGLRRSRVEKVAADAQKTNNRKASGPVGKALFKFLMPIALKTFLKPEKMFGALHGYRINWDDAVTA